MLYSHFQQVIKYDGIIGIRILKVIYSIDNFRDYIFPDMNFNTILHMEHTLETIQYLVDYENCRLNDVNEFLMSPLYYQTRGDVIKYLIDNGCDMDLCENDCYFFCGDRDLEATKFYISRDLCPFDFKINYNIFDYTLHEYLNPVLIRAGHSLYENHSNIMISGICLIKDRESLNYIFNYYENIKEQVNKKNKYNENALFYIYDPYLFKLFLENGADPNCINIYGYSLLQIHSNLEIIKLLLEYKADIDYVLIETRKNKLVIESVIDFHEHMKHNHIVQYLKRYKNCLKIQKIWRDFINKKKYVPISDKNIKNDIIEQINYMPPIKELHFQGGIEYRKAFEHYTSLE